MVPSIRMDNGLQGTLEVPHGTRLQAALSGLPRAQGQPRLQLHGRRLQFLLLQRLIGERAGHTLQKRLRLPLLREEKRARECWVRGMEQVG